MRNHNTFLELAATATRCRLAALLVAAMALLASQPANAGILSGTGTGTITLDTSAGGGPIETLGPAAYGPYPGDLFYTGPAVSGPVLALMAESWSFTLPAAAPFDVFLNHHPASPPSPSGETFLLAKSGTGFTSTLEGDFTVIFTLDDIGLGETLIPKISYPVFWVGSVGVESFDAMISYSDDFGALGTRVLHFHPAPGSTGIALETGFGALDLLPLPPGDHLTLTGSFLLSVNAMGGTGTEIKVLGIPEPSSIALAFCGLVSLAGYLRLKDSIRTKTRAFLEVL